MAALMPLAHKPRAQSDRGPGLAQRRRMIVGKACRNVWAMSVASASIRARILVLMEMRGDSHLEWREIARACSPAPLITAALEVRAWRFIGRTVAWDFSRAAFLSGQIAAFRRLEPAPPTITPAATVPAQDMPGWKWSKRPRGPTPYTICLSSRSMTATPSGAAGGIWHRHRGPLSDPRFISSRLRSESAN